jgi:hypothetical protein
MEVITKDMLMEEYVVKQKSTRQIAQELVFVKQQNKCAISGVLIVLTPKSSRTASLDRIDSAKGYTTDNIQWVHKTINIIKWNLSCDQFIKWCKIVARNN